MRRAGGRCGPAGLAAAVCGASATASGTVAPSTPWRGRREARPPPSSRIEAYLGFPSGISGGELIERAVLQAHKFAARLMVPAQVSELTPQDGEYVVTFTDGSRTRAGSVVLASGVSYRRLEVPGIDRLEGISVYYAATVHEASLCQGDPVAVVGGGNSAGQAALFLANSASVVHLLVRGGDLNADMSRYLVDQVERHRRSRCCSTPKSGASPGREAGVADRGGQHKQCAPGTARRGAVRVHRGPAAYGMSSGACWPWTKKGFVLTGADARAAADTTRWDPLGRGPLLLETTLPGVFAPPATSRSGSVKRVASATGEGAMAIRLVHEHREQTGNLVRTTGPGRFGGGGPRRAPALTLWRTAAPTTRTPAPQGVDARRGPGGWCSKRRSPGGSQRS
ncbi:NAD(P)/FAD-dependent oxidoreductase [Yinghuangia aomiensis]